MDAIGSPSAGAATRFRALPDPAPLDMPVRPLDAPAARTGRLPTSPRFVFWRRAFVIGTTIVMTGLAAREMYRVLSVATLTSLEALVLLLFVALFAWIAFSFVSAVGGFFSMLAGGGNPLGIATSGPLPTLSTRTALLMPTYNESPTRVMAGLQAIHESLKQTGAGAQFDIFILSDTTDPDIWIEEEAAFLALRQRTGDHERIFYRRRPRNTERKSGNIADWVRRFGAAYPQMLVLDADSVMTGEAIVRLVAAMERHEHVGLIQTLPVIVNGTTLFARLQQFAGRVYGPLIAHGIAWWHGGDSNYWGHNAVIRTRAFAEQAGLPVLHGRKPFGGHILSHDFVEAAFLRRGGWAVHMAPALRGTYEESPPSMMDLAIRDRRWCQGNLQHMAVLRGRGLHWVSRLHLLTGIGSYITAPMWLLFLIAGVLISLQARFIRPEYFPAGRSLFPRWPVIDPVRAMWVFVITMGVLLAPKLLSFIVLLCSRTERRGCGGAIRAFLSMVVETLIAGMIAPVTMVVQSVDVLAILAGRDSGWNAQRRDDGGIPSGFVVRRYWRHMVFGILLGIGAYEVSPLLAAWMSPVVLGLALAIPLALLTARRSLGLAFRRLGLLLTPEERDPPPVLVRARALFRELQSVARQMDGVHRLLDDPALLDAHRAMLPPPRRKGDPIDVPLLTGLTKLLESDTLAEALAALDTREKTAVLADARGVDRLLALCGGRF